MSISVKDSGNNIVALKSTVVGGEHITHHNVDISALPTGASTGANQSLILAALLAQATKVDTQPVTIATNSAGIATQATLAAANTSLASILTALGLVAKLSDTQPVSIVGGGLALDASIQSILNKLVYPLSPVTAQYAENAADITDLTQTVLVSGVPGSVIRVHAVIMNNKSATVGTMVRLVKASDSTKLRTYYAPLGSAKAYPVGLIAPFDVAQDIGLSVLCETTGAAVRAAVVYTLI